MTSPHPVIAERPLVRHARHADHRSIHDLLRRHHARIYSITLAALQRPEIAEQVVLDTFAEALEALPRLGPGQLLFPGLVRINARRILCRIHSRDGLESDLLPPGPGLAEARAWSGAPTEWREDEPLLDAHLRQVIALAVARLPAVPRAELALCDLGGLSYSDLADASGTTTNAVRRNLHEARVRIVEAIETHFRQAHSMAEPAKPFFRSRAGERRRDAR
ncbi:MAG: RNA polymerase sigma factor [Deltaproteobacteria bacterium]|nr:RNA polymerase sigma factor [Deltaproteobacteria bacterium]